MGKKGLQEVAMQNAQKTAYAAKKISEIDGFSLAFDSPNFNEFVVTAPSNAKDLLDKLSKENNILGGIALSKYYKDRPNDFLVCVTETNTKEQIDSFVDALT